MDNKRLFDLVIVIVCLPVVLPIYLVSVLLLAIFQGTPIHFSQKRVGKGEEEFLILKFRSMTNNPAQSGSFQTKVNDERITKIGKYFRTLSLDEIPQLLNVLKGDMSIIGPRPFLLAQKGNYDRRLWEKRLEVKPGITGLAQVSGRSNCPVEKRIQLDIEYIGSQSLILDLRILLRTILIVFLRKDSN